jgi:hypothetical protein
MAEIHLPPVKTGPGRTVEQVKADHEAEIEVPDYPPGIHWTITSEKEPQWNGQGTTEEDVFLIPPEAIQHFKQCREKFGEPSETVELKVVEGNASSHHFLTATSVAQHEAHLAEQRPVPPVEEVPNLTLQELWLVLKFDSYRQGKTWVAACNRLEEIAWKLPTMGYFITGQAPEALKLVQPMTDEERTACIEYLKAGNVGISYRGFAGCRICGKQLGTRCNITPDGKWRYPHKWDHYVEEHGCRPPKEEFIQDALAWFRARNAVKFQPLMTRDHEPYKLFFTGIEWPTRRMEKDDEP